MAKIFIQTYGCTHNVSDSEVMAGLLKKEKHTITTKQEKADVIIINTCTVKHNAETKFFNFLEKCSKPVVIAGCITQAEQSYAKTKLKNHSIIGIDQINKIGEIIKKTLNGETVHMLKRKNNPKRPRLPKTRKNKIVEIVTINSGCLGNCTYCKTKQARGKLYSYKKETLIKQIKDAIKTGIKEIWLTSQDTGAYGQDLPKKTTLPELLIEILKINGNYKIRLGMCNPNWVHKYLNELTTIYQNPKMFKFLHIPVQSGNNRILKEMKRKYTIEQYKKTIKKIRKYNPDITIATDIICGFPRETEKEFKDTINLIKETKPDVLNISRFWPRPNTVAAKMKQINPKTAKERSMKLNKLFQKITYDNNNKWLGWKGEIIIDEKGKNNTWIGRNQSYKQVITQKNCLIGDVIEVKIKNISMHDLRDF